MGAPSQVTEAFVKLGVTVNVTVTAALVVLVKLPVTLPLPLAAIPVTVAILSLVQLNTVPDTFPDKTTFVIGDPVQIS